MKIQCTILFLCILQSLVCAEEQAGTTKKEVITHKIADAVLNEYQTLHPTSAEGLAVDASKVEKIEYTANHIEFFIQGKIDSTRLPTKPENRQKIFDALMKYSDKEVRNYVEAISETLATQVSKENKKK